jgi:crossover junction endodeoxyribonuclease RuvC
LNGIIVAGINLGLTGAIAFYVPSLRRVAVHDMPVVDGEVGAPDLAELVRKHRPTIGIIERVHPMRGQCECSIPNVGRSVSDLRGVFGALGIPLHSVTPQKWKGAFGLIGKGKDASRTLAIKMFPQIASDLQLKKHHGRGDALLLARWGADELLLQSLFSPVWRGFASKEDFHGTKGDHVDE